MKTYTKTEVIQLIESLSESLAENVLCVEQIQKEGTSETQSFFNMGQLSAFETVDVLLSDTIEDLKSE